MAFVYSHLKRKAILGGALLSLFAALIPSPLAAKNFSRFFLSRGKSPLTNLGQLSETFYEKYVQQADITITQLYHDRWGLPGNRRRHIPLKWGYEHTLMHRPFTGNALEERDARSQLAAQVVRLRVQRMIAAYLAQSHASVVDMHPISAAARHAREMDAPKRQTGGVRFDYDVLSDNVRLEYYSELVNSGFFHPRLMGGALSGGYDEDLAYYVTFFTGKGKPAVTVNYPAHGRLVQTGISHLFSRSTDANLLLTAPLRDANVPLSAQLTVVHRF